MKAVAQTETRTIPAGEFKAKCLKLMDEVMEGNLTLIVTKRGKAVMQATAPTAPKEKPFRSLFGRSPNIQVPSEEKWRKLKSEWADEWDRSSENFVRDFVKPHNKNKKAKK